RDPAGHTRPRAAVLDLPRRLDERARVVVVLLDPRPYSEDVRVEDQVFGGEARPLGEQPVRALADLDLPLDRVGLALLVEGHDDDAGAVAAHATRLLEHRVLALLEAQRVDDSLSLQALHARFEDRPLRAVDHDREPRDLR